MSKRTMTAWMGAALALGALAQIAPAQTASKADSKVRPDVVNPVAPTPPKKVRAIRKPVVDLQEMAKDRRPGQVMPGDPAPMGGARPADTIETPEAALPIPSTKPAGSTGATGVPESSTPASGARSIRLPDTAPYAKPPLKPESDTAARAEVMNGTMPAPAPATEVAAPVVETTAPVAATHEATAPTPAPAPAPVAQAAPVPAAPALERPEVAGVPLVDGVVMMQTPAPASMGAASVRVESVSGNPAGVQWRAGNGAWAKPEAGATLEGKVEVRAGLDAQVVLVVDGATELHLSRLGRVVVERANEAKGGTSASVQLQRGSVDVRPAPGASAGAMFARVRTPDQSFGVVGPLRVEYDPFTGTRRRVGNQ